MMAAPNFSLAVHHPGSGQGEPQVTWEVEANTFLHIEASWE